MCAFALQMGSIIIFAISHTLECIRMGTSACVWPKYNHLANVHLENEIEYKLTTWIRLLFYAIHAVHDVLQTEIKNIEYRIFFKYINKCANVSKNVVWPTENSYSVAIIYFIDHELQHIGYLMRLETIKLFMSNLAFRSCSR